MLINFLYITSCDELTLFMYRLFTHLIDSLKNILKKVQNISLKSVEVSINLMVKPFFFSFRKL